MWVPAYHWSPHLVGSIRCGTQNNANAVRTDEPPAHAMEFGTQFSLTQEEPVRNRADVTDVMSILDVHDEKRAKSIRDIERKRKMRNPTQKCLRLSQ